MKLWYNQPAKKWNEALPIGNGRLGGMVFGGIKKENIQLNEDSIWSGKPFFNENPEMRKNISRVQKLLFAGKYVEAEKIVNETMTTENDPRYGSYKPLGNLSLSFSNPEKEVTNYCRELNLNKAVVSTSFQVGDTIFKREIFSTAALIVIKTQKILLKI